MSLRVWLPLDGDLRNLGCSNLQFQLVSTNTSIDTSGKIGSCYKNNSRTAGGIVSTSKITLGQQHSMFCWFKFTSLTSASTLGGGLVTTHWHGTNSGTGITIRYVSSTTGYLSVNTGNGSSRTYNAYYGTTLLQANTWYHGGFTYDGTNIKIYVNGNLEKTQAYANMSMPENYIGVHCWSLNSTTPYADYKFIGSINDVRIYDHCLSAAEVHEIAQGLILHYKLDGGVIGNPNLLPNSKVDGTWTYPSNSYSDKYYVTANTISSGTQYTLSFDAKSTVNGDKIRTFYYNPNTTTTCVSSQGITKTAVDGNMDFTLSTDWKRYWVVYTQTSTTAAKNIICPRLVSGQGSGTVSVKNVKLEEGSVATAWRLAENTQTLIEDSSGYNRNAISNGSQPVTIVADTPRYSASTKFIAGARIATPVAASQYLPVDAITTNIWIKSSNAANRFLSCTESGGWNFESNSGYVRVPLYISGKGYTYCNSSTTTWSSLSDNKWHMLSFTYDRQQLKIYIDGTIDTTADSSYPNINIAYRSNTPLTIGAESQTLSSPIAGTYVGNISDLRIYCTALSAQDIKQLYELGMKIDNGYNLHTFEVVENNNKISLNNKRQFKCDEVVESELAKFFKREELVEAHQIVEF